MKEVRTFMGGLGNRLFQYAFLHSQVRQGNLPDIYLQDYRIFNRYKEELRQVFGIPGNVRAPYISLHIRRGDYVNNSHYIDLCSTSYYQEAVKHFPDGKFQVFCQDNQGRDKEDQKWCKEFLDGFIKDRYIMAIHGTETEDLERMTCCSGHIMANSSFSFWASYLDPRKNKTIAPKQWFSDGHTIPLPEEFIQI